ncbi:MAG: pentapeptide repeat-containing protein, partial [Ktedonobacteraceae bacterium]
NKHERAETKQRAEVEHAIAQDSQREILLQTYLDRMSDLILTNQLLRSDSETIEVRHIARVRTMTVLLRLDDDRKGSLIRFLYDAGLISIDKGTGKSIINLSGANLSNADLNRANLIGADLRGADLSGAKLSFARLDDAHLEKANLSEANLTGAHLSDAHLVETKLGGAKLRGTNLKWAHLNDADIRKADLYRADISRADLSGANLSEINLVDVIFDAITVSNETNLVGVTITPEQQKIIERVSSYIP